ncbi:MAG TPA: hypothetical protein VF541_19705 [Longimicrobium sp.]
MTAPAVPAAPPLDPENPWPGLDTFREVDAAFFRGRTGKAGELLRLVRRERLTVLFGISGLGKSSLLQAGLFPLLRDEALLPVYVRLVHAPDAPPLRAQVLAALEAAAAEARLEAPPPAAPGATLWEAFHRQGARFWTAGNLPVTPVLVLDQFEEAFTLGREKGRARATAEFLDELGDLVEGRAPPPVRSRIDQDPYSAREFVFNQHPYKVLLCVREDFLAEMETLRARIPSIASNRMRLTPLSGRAALEATGAGGAALVPPGVGELIVRLVAEQRQQQLPLDELTVDPALLSLFCRELNERRRARRLPSISAELVTGNRESILAGFYENSLRGLGSGVRTLIEERLLTVRGFRDSEDVDNALAAPGVTPQALDTLVGRRLIRREERGGQTRIELTHDVLTAVVRQSRDQRRAHRRVRRWIVMTVLCSLLGVGALALAASAWRSKQVAQEREREAILEAELGTELQRAEHDQRLQATARDSAVLLLARASRRRAQSLEAALERALCGAPAGDPATLQQVRRQVESEMGNIDLCPVR